MTHAAHLNTRRTMLIGSMSLRMACSVVWFALVFAATATATTIGAGTLPIQHEPSRPFAMSPAGQIVVTGTIGSGGATLVLRIDDAQTPAYDDRLNHERTLPAGPFSMTLTPTDLKTSSGRPLDLQNLYRIILFGTDGADRVTVSAVTMDGKLSPTPATQSARANPAERNQPIQTGRISPDGTLTLGAGSLPLVYEPKRPAVLDATDQIDVEGSIADGGATVVTRIDDSLSPSYNERLNEERTLAAGPFRLTLTAAELKTSGGRPLNLNTIRQIIFFATDGEPRVRVTRFAITNDNTAPQQRDLSTLSLGTGVAPIHYTPSTVFSGRGREFIVEGTNTATETRSVLLRVDDQQSSDYASRANIERDIPPGAFRLRIPAAGLVTPRKRTLDPDALRFAHFTPWPETSDIAVTRFDLAPIRAFPQGTHAFAFGAADAALPAGFERISVPDPRIKGDNLLMRRRPKPDPLVANGIRGISRITLKVPPGDMRVTIWSEDPGEWEDLPRTSQRTIHVNGQLLMSENLTPKQWLETRYLANQWQEHTASDDAWNAFGQHRGNPQSLTVKSNGTITIDLTGATADETFISAVLIEPANSTEARSHVESDRAEWYRTNWRTSQAVATAYEPATAEAGQIHSIRMDQQSTAGITPVAVALAAGTGTRLTLSVSDAETTAVPDIALTQPESETAGTKPLNLKAWAGQWRLDRTLPHDTQLNLRDDRLIADLNRLPITPDRPRRYELWLSAPEDAAPGTYRGAFTITSNGRVFEIPIAAEVLTTRLPPAMKPVGPYLGHAPHLQWFAGDTRNASLQAVCDLRVLANLGLKGTAPPVTVPYQGGTENFEAEMQRAKDAGLAAGWLVYNPLHHLSDRYGHERAAKFAAGATLALKRGGIAPPIWSAADEPSNPDQVSGELIDWVATLRRTGGPDVRIGGHLNAPADNQFVTLFDVIIINPSFGMNRNQVRNVTSDKRRVWFYNTWAPRLTGGVWLHFTTADRYVQWHARMPTANPFDPLDGREGDAQMFYPEGRPCADQPNIHRSLLQLAEGVVDQRWLLWLDQQTDAPARNLARKIRDQIPDAWTDANRWTAADLNAIREQILQLVKNR